ncbi:MAG: hypothetical protein R3Y08_00060 [Rikenellaceae bacterium]
MFINIPDNYSSLWGELIFEYNSTLDTDIVMSVVDEFSGETIAVKKFYSSTDAKINITPLLFETMLPQPYFLSSGAVAPSVGFPKISVNAGGQSSGELLFTYARKGVEPPIMLTTMPTSRLLARGESDYITLIAPSGTTIKYRIEGVGLSADSAPLYQNSITSINGGARQIRIVADEYADEYSSIKVTLLSDDQEFGQVNYAFSELCGASYRVAWISSQGSIEHYTFPVVEEQVRLSSGAIEKSLRSAYGTAQEIDALSEIVSSPTVWRATQEGYTKLELLTTQIATRREGTLTIANVKVVEYD